MKLIREIACLWIKQSDCNGGKTFVRHDNWHPEDVLLCRFGHWIVLEAANNVYAKVSNILKQVYYFCPTTRIEVVVNF